MVVDTRQLNAESRKAAIDMCWAIACDRSKLVLISAALICDRTTDVVWMLQHPMEPEDIATFTKRAPQ